MHYNNPKTKLEQLPKVILLKFCSNGQKYRTLNIWKAKKIKEFSIKSSHDLKF